MRMLCACVAVFGAHMSAQLLLGSLRTFQSNLLLFYQIDERNEQEEGGDGDISANSKKIRRTVVTSARCNNEYFRRFYSRRCFIRADRCVCVSCRVMAVWNCARTFRHIFSGGAINVREQFRRFICLFVGFFFFSLSSSRFHLERALWRSCVDCKTPWCASRVVCVICRCVNTIKSENCCSLFTLMIFSRWILEWTAAHLCAAAHTDDMPGKERTQPFLRLLCESRLNISSTLIFMIAQNLRFAFFSIFLSSFFGSPFVFVEFCFLANVHVMFVVDRIAARHLLCYFSARFWYSHSRTRYAKRLSRGTNKHRAHRRRSNKMVHKIDFAACWFFYCVYSRMKRRNYR